MRRVIFLKKEGQFWNLAGHFINAKMQQYLLCQISGHHLDCFYKSLHLATFPNIRRLSLCLIEGFSMWCLPQLSLNLNLGNFYLLIYYQVASPSVIINCGFCVWYGHDDDDCNLTKFEMVVLGGAVVQEDRLNWKKRFRSGGDLDIFYYQDHHN